MGKGPATATADPYGMTNKRRGNDKGDCNTAKAKQVQIQGSFAALRMTT
jgi:hypothetical protein